MTFTATHTRALTGSDVTVTVAAGNTESIASVTVSLDGDILEELELTSGTENYARMFSGVGGAEPGMDHTLVVTAVDDRGTPHSATTRWSDS